MRSKRSSDIDDGMANMMYRFRSVGAGEISGPPATTGGASSDSSKNKTAKTNSENMEQS